VSFLIACPTCGPRNVYEFRFGGEVLQRPAPDADADAWTAYRYMRVNMDGDAREWWFHSAGCRRWFVARRDTVRNAVLEIERPAIG
jgi:heterotetrameric sarcosine oxidase delta subunit